MARKKPLTPRQQEVVSLANGDLTVADIASRLNITEPAVYGHLTRIRARGHEITVKAGSNGHAPLSDGPMEGAFAGVGDALRGEEDLLQQEVSVLDELQARAKEAALAIEEQKDRIANRQARLASLRNVRETFDTSLLEEVAA